MQAQAVLPRSRRTAVSAAFAAQGLGFAVLVTHLPDFTDRYRLSDAGVTLLLFGVTVLAGVGSVASEALARRTSSGTALRTGLTGAAAGLATAALAPGLPLAAVGFAVYGLAVGAVDATSNMQAVDVQHAYGRSIITSFHAWWSAAAIAGALYVAGGGALDLGLAVSILPVAVAVLLVAGTIGRFLSTPGDAPVGPFDGDLAAGDLAAGDLAAGDLAAGDLAAGERGGDDAGATLPLRPILLLGAALTCFWAVDSGISNWSALFLDDTFQAGSAAALGYAGYQLTGLLSRLGGDLAVRRFGAVATVRTSGLIACLGTVLVITAPSAPVAVLGFAVTGAGLPVVAPLCFTAAASAARRVGGGSAAIDHTIARLNVFNYAGSLIGAAAVGAIGSLTELRWGFVVSLLLAAAVVGLAADFRTDDERPTSDG